MSLGDRVSLSHATDITWKPTKSTKSERTFQNDREDVLSFYLTHGSLKII
mgnify:CR=1